jgi:DNA helicase II / ATP-dependent DNA helicase PcrA
MRFPESGDLPHRLEDELRPFGPHVGRPREQIDRAFDDLYRLYYVAFSRPKDVLLLVGLTSSMALPNIAQGWTRGRKALWGTDPPWKTI